MSSESTLKELFDEIINKLGPYSQDQLTHAGNVIDKASKNAIEIKRRLIASFITIVREGENGESTDCVTSAKYMLKDLGEHVE